MTTNQENLKELLKADSKSKKSVEAATKHPNKLGAGAAKRKKLKKPEDKVAAVMKEFKNGTLHSGSGEIVTDIKQAKAIAMSEAGLSKAQIDLQFELLKAKPKEILKEKAMTKAQENLKQELQKAKYKTRKRVGNKWVYTYDEPKGKEAKGKEAKEELVKPKIPSNYKYPITFNGKKYLGAGEADFTNRVFPGWYGDANKGDSYVAEYSETAYDAKGNRVRIIYQFDQIKGEEDNVDSLDWENNVVNVKPID